MLDKGQDEGMQFERFISDGSYKDEIAPGLGYSEDEDTPRCSEVEFRAKLETVEMVVGTVCQLKHCLERRVVIFECVNNERSLCNLIKQDDR